MLKIEIDESEAKRLIEQEDCVEFYHGQCDCASNLADFLEKAINKAHNPTGDSMAELASRFTWLEFVDHEASTRGINYADTDPAEIPNLKIIGELEDGTALYELVPSAFPERPTALPEGHSAPVEEEEEEPPVKEEPTVEELIDDAGTSGEMKE